MCNNEPAQTEHKLEAPHSPQSGEISAFMNFFLKLRGLNLDTRIGHKIPGISY